MIDIIVIPLSLVFILFFSGIKKAFIKSDQLRLELDIKNETPGSGIISLFTKDPSSFSVAMLTGCITSIALFSITFYLQISPAVDEVTDSYLLILLINLLLFSILIILASEILPAAIFERSPNTYLKVLAVPALFFFLIFYPVAKLLLFVTGLFYVSSTVTGFKRDEPVMKSDFLTQHNNVDDILPVSSGSSHNIRIFRNLLDLSGIMVKEIMVPRTEIEAVPINDTVEQLREKFINTRYARILVYQDTIDNIAGYFEVKDLFKNPPDIRSSLRKLIIIPETMTANRLLKTFVAEKKNIAVVVDEFGGTSGMVTIEDLLEEIVGDIEDEHDTNDLVERVKDNEYILSGRLEIDYLNEKYGLNLPETDDYATLAGMVLFYNGSIPGNNDVIRIGNMTVKILRASATRIELVKLTVEK